ncbi:hypothetical protein PC116_g8852 [Phytophthora cactorum]|nr:hypothetical protein PC116_g8852 [Phytophthora cactorum]
MRGSSPTETGAAASQVANSQPDLLHIACSTSDAGVRNVKKGSDRDGRCSNGTYCTTVLASFFGCCARPDGLFDPARRVGRASLRLFQFVSNNSSPKWVQTIKFGFQLIAINWDSFGGSYCEANMLVFSRLQLVWNSSFQVISKFSTRTLQHQRAGAACELVDGRRARAKELEQEVSLQQAEVLLLSEPGDAPGRIVPAHRPMQRYACSNSSWSSKTIWNPTSPRR